MSNLKIMTAMYTIKKGGAYDRFLMMLEAFLERDCEIHCLSLTPLRVKSPLFKNHVIRLPFCPIDRTFTRISVLFLFPFCTLLMGWREKVDLFIAFNSLYAFIQAVPKWVLKKPMVTLIRGDFTFGLKMRDSFKSFLWLNKAIEYFGLIASDKILTVNAAMRENIMKVIKSRKNKSVEVLTNNIPVLPHTDSAEAMKLRSEYAIANDAKVLVTAGILNRGKNIEMLIRSVSKMSIENLFLLIIGDGSTKGDRRYVDYLKQMAKGWGIEKKVIFTGWLAREDLWRAFRAADLFVLPSLSEGMPNVMLEALGVDLPCFGSRIAGITDILQYEELMFDPQNDESMMQKLKEYFFNGENPKRIKKSCSERKRAFIFDWKERVFQMVTSGIVDGVQ